MDLVVLAGSVGKGAAWARGCMKPLLPLPARSSLLEELLRRLDIPSIQQCVVCSDGHQEQYENRLQSLTPFHFQLEFFEDSVPLGTAGCLKACQSMTESDTILVVGGSVWLEDDPEWMLQQHLLQGNAVTVFCTRDPAWNAAGAQRHLRPAGIYCCDRVVFDHIRPQSFQDLKEQLVPALQRAGLRVGVVPLQNQSCEVSAPATYMETISRMLSAGCLRSTGFARIAPDIWCGRNPRIASHVRIVGPVFLGHNCRIDEGAVIVGPTMLADETHIGRRARLIRVIAPHPLRIRPGMYLTDRVLTAPRDRWINDRQSTVDRVLPPEQEPQSSWYRARLWPRSVAAPATAVGTMIFAVIIWAFWASIGNLWSILSVSAHYSTENIVPVAALYVLAFHRVRHRSDFRFWLPGSLNSAIGLGTRILRRMADWK